MNKWSKRLLQAIAVVLVLALGGFGARRLSAFRKPPEKKPLQRTAPLLKGMRVKIQSRQMTVTGFGTVEPRREIQVVPQVSGRIISRHAQFVDGGFFKTNASLITIEKADYLLLVESARAAVAQARVELEREQAEAQVAREQWNKLHPGQQPPSILVFREPHVRSAQAQLQAAQAQLARAELDLERTEITLPFDGYVVSTSVDVGQYVTPGQAIATVYATDAVEIVMPLDNEDLAWFDIKQQPKVRVKTDFAGTQHQWQGRVVRMQSRIDDKSRLVPVVVQVDAPFVHQGDRPALMPGMFVEVEIFGKHLKQIVVVPRYVIRNGQKVWRVQDVQASDKDNASGIWEGKLMIHPVRIIRLDKQWAYVSEGLDDGDMLITSSLDTVTHGMDIRVQID